MSQVSIFKPKIVSINDSDSYKKFKELNVDKKLKVVNGKDSYDEILDYETDIVVAAVTGSDRTITCYKSSSKVLPLH